MVSNPVIQYVLFEGLSSRLQRLRKVASLSGSEAFAIGAFAKWAATVLTYPLLTIKTRLQTVVTPLVSPARGGGAPAAPREGAIALALRMLREEGVSSFYSGIGTKIFQSVLAAALLFSLKEEISKAALLALTAASQRRKAAARALTLKSQ